MAERKKNISSLEEDPDEITVLESEDVDCESESENCVRPEKKSQSLRKKIGLKLNLSSLTSSPKKEKKEKARHEESAKHSKNGTVKTKKRRGFWMLNFRSKSKDDSSSRHPCQHSECCSPCCSRSRSFRERLRRRASKENALDHGDYGHLNCPACRHNHQHHHNTDEHMRGTGVVFTTKKKRMIHAIDLESFNPDDYPTTDIDEKMREVRAREMEEGVPVDLVPSRPTLDTLVPPPVRNPTPPDAMNAQLEQLECSFSNGCVIRERVQKVDCQEPIPRSASGSVISDSSVHMVGQYGCLTPNGSYAPRTVHTQIDYIHCLVPDLITISGSGFYWGRMDRYEAEKQLEGKPEGTFLLRDSAQEEFLFSVSFRRYGRSLHARIEQWNHKFSFDAHDPGVFSAGTVCGLLEHYKDPNFCMFFEPMLTIPLPRPNTLTLQHLCRAVICTHMRYDDIKFLCLPSSLREYLREYHYKQKVRVRRFEIDGPTEKEIY